MASSKPQQPTLCANLMACLSQDDLTDIHLLGTDGIKVPAFRAVLACQSDVFRKMLVGHFEESTSKVVELCYSSVVLRAVVEFCITDKVTQFDNRSDESVARGIVQLAACAHFLTMPLLQDKAQSLVNSLMERYKCLACAVFDEASLFPELTESIKRDAIGTIRKFPKDCLLSKPGLTSLSGDALGEVVSDDKLGCEEIILFRALHEWSTVEVKAGSADLGSEEGRASIAKKLVATHVRLSLIQPTDLKDIVSKSYIVDKNMMYEAFEAQAIRAQKECNMQFSKKRKVIMHDITVSGAGADVVNGFYNRNGEHNGFPKYTKKCTWKGKNRTLCIYRHGGNCWYIAIVETDGSIGSNNCDFYGGRTAMKVPSEGWMASELGSNPCPVCHES